MKEIEITKAPELDATKERIVDLHSVFNILNVIVLQLGELAEDLSEAATTFEELETQVLLLADRFRYEDDLSPLIESLQDIKSRLLAILEGLQNKLNTAEAENRLEIALQNFRSIDKILDVRIRELNQRLGNSDVYIEIDAHELRKELKNVFEAIERNAAGRYYIRFNLALKDTTDYYIDLRIETLNEDIPLTIPMRFKDVLRDLLANARKYTKPGGRISFAVHQAEDALHCVIEDEGCGIPEDELDRVVEYGYRASNVRDRPTMGGGFGLTKAASLVLKWGGRFSIRSEENIGTCVRISIPIRTDSLAQ